MNQPFWQTLSHHDTHQSLSHGYGWLLFLGLVIAIIVRILLFNRYCPHCVDHAWSASYAFDYFNYGIEYDRAFNSQSGTMEFFGKTHAYVYGLLAEVFEWNSQAIRLYSTFFVILGGAIWSLLVYHLSQNKRIAYTVFIFILLFDAFISASNLSRPEALVFCLITIISWLSFRKHYFLATLLVGIAFETHIFGAIGITFVLSFFITNKNYLSKKSIFSILLGGGVGLLYYLLLHWHTLPELPHRIAQNSSDGFANLLLGYFFKARYYRHLPEFFILIYCLFLVYKNKLYQSTPIKIVLTILCLIFIFSFIAPRSNQNYGLYVVLPALTLLALIISRTHHPKLWLMLSLCYYLPQYGYLYVKHHDYSEKNYLSQLEKYTNKEGIYLGHHLHWFLFEDDRKKHFFSIDNPNAPIKNSTFTLIRDPYLEAINTGPNQQLLTRLQDCQMTLKQTHQDTNNHRTIRFEHVDCQ